MFFVPLKFSIEPVTFRWDPNDPSEGITGYRLYMTDTSGSYAFGDDSAIGKTLAGTETVTVEVPPNQLWYFVVTAYRLLEESGPSNEVSYGAIVDAPLSPPANLEEVSELVISNLSVSNGKIYEIVQSLGVGEFVYVDRTHTFTNVPEYFQGAAYIKTANSDKYSTGDDFVNFDVNQDVTVYIGYDVRNAELPPWLLNFVDTGDEIITTDTSFRLYAKDFPAGLVVLGGNYATGNSMYTVAVTEAK